MSPRVRTSQIENGPKQRFTLCGSLLAIAMSLSAGNASAQSMAQADSRYYPLNQMAPPGLAGQFSVARHPDAIGYFQPIRVELPGGGKVSFYMRDAEQPITLVSPANVATLVGPLYRMQISHMPAFPGVELYPSVELLDRLHPPAGRLADYTIPVTFTPEEIRFAIEGRLVTKVVYLERPQIADGARVEGDATELQTFPPRQNLIAVADKMGRPMAILRLGGRIPSPDAFEPEFFGPGAPVLLPRSPGAVPAGPVSSRQPVRQSPASQVVQVRAVKKVPARTDESLSP